ncbi:hypothetical protein R1sor_027406 [Riccia sorocarpa]|uniref:Uncharacterized protein n=1 Tax=Riccia sorocarpa TaxID=122646 RepID=A0ABD3GE41_9MARC
MTLKEGLTVENDPSIVTEELLPDPPLAEFSPSVPSERKTRVLSSSSEHGGFRTPIRSPLHVLVRSSPANSDGGTRQVPAVMSLCKFEPPSRRNGGTWRERLAMVQRVVPAQLILEEDVPILRPPMGSKNQ